MGLIANFFSMLFGDNRNVIKETTEVFRENAEAAAQRDASYNHAALAQFAAEFAVERRGWFDRFVDGLNRLPRPLLALGTLGLLVSAMTSPIWFAERMVGIGLVPEPLWWLLGVIVSFYFGARHQAKTQEFQQSITASLGRVPQVVQSISQLRELRADSPGVASTDGDAELELATITDEDKNQALEDWRARS